MSSSVYFLCFWRADLHHFQLRRPLLWNNLIPTWTIQRGCLFRDRHLFQLKSAALYSLHRRQGTLLTWSSRFLSFLAISQRNYGRINFCNLFKGKQVKKPIYQRIYQRSHLSWRYILSEVAAFKTFSATQRQMNKKNKRSSLPFHLIWTSCDSESEKNVSGKQALSIPNLLRNLITARNPWHRSQQDSVESPLW